MPYTSRRSHLQPQRLLRYQRQAAQHPKLARARVGSKARVIAFPLLPARIGRHQHCRLPFSSVSTNAFQAFLILLLASLAKRTSWRRRQMACHPSSPSYARGAHFKLASVRRARRRRRSRRRHIAASADCRSPCSACGMRCARYRSRRSKGYGARDERELQISFPVRPRRHGDLQHATRAATLERRLRRPSSVQRCRNHVCAKALAPHPFQSFHGRRTRSWQIAATTEPSPPSLPRRTLRPAETFRQVIFRPCLAPIFPLPIRRRRLSKIRETFLCRRSPIPRFRSRAIRTIPTRAGLFDWSEHQSAKYRKEPIQDALSCTRRRHSFLAL